MDIRQLHYFLVLCEEMNYTRAAQRLFLSRQALRQSISALEAELCGPLFLSAHHRLSLTDRGVSLQRHAARRSVPCTSNGSTTNHYESKNQRSCYWKKNISIYGCAASWSGSKQ